MSTRSSEDLSLVIGEYIVTNKATVRAAALRFGISKSAVHQIVMTELQLNNAELFNKVRAVMDENKNTRHIRGGDATRKFYQNGGTARRPKGQNK